MEQVSQECFCVAGAGRAAVGSPSSAQALPGAGSGLWHRSVVVPSSLEQLLPPFPQVHQLLEMVPGLGDAEDCRSSAEGQPLGEDSAWLELGTGPCYVVG